MLLASSLRTLIRWIVAITMYLGFVYLYLMAFGVVPSPYDCIATDLQNVRNLSGFDFTVVETDCDRIAKEAYISVFVAKSGDNRRTLVFKYDPALDPMPTITSVDPHTVQISVPRISYLFSKKDKWNDLSIIYKIGVIDYVPGGKQQGR